jgi:hypothetical protein
MANITANIKLNRSVTNFFSNSLGHGLLLLAFGWCIYILYLVTEVSDIAINADLLQLPTMLLDFKSNPSNLWGWKLPDAPYYFPDTVVFFIIGWLVNNTLVTIIVYSLIQNYLLFWSWRWLYCELGGKKLLICDLCFLLALLLFTTYHAIDLPGFPNITSIYLINLLSYHHFGAYVASIFCLAAWFNYLRTARFKILFLCGLIVFLTTASDFIFIIYLTLPLLIVSGMSFKLKPIERYRLKIITVVLVISSAIAYLFNKTIDPWSNKLKLQPDGEIIINSLSALTDDLLFKMTFLEKLLLLFIAIAPLIYWLFSILTTQKSSLKTKRIDSNIFCLKLFILLAAIINLLGTICFGKYLDWGSMRYFLPIYYSPLIFSLLLLSLSLEKLSQQSLKIIQTSLIIIISAIILILTSPLKIKPVTEILQPPDYIACFNPKTAGFAGYWESKPIILFSQRTIQVATITDMGEPYYWNNNRYWYEDSWNNPGNKPQFQFIFMRSLKPEKILQKYGQPDRKQNCGDNEIWWYDKTLNIN